MLTNEFEEIINKNIDKLINKHYKTGSDEFLTELKMRIWDYVNTLNDEIDSKTLEEIINNIKNPNEFVKENYNPEYKWALNKIVSEDMCSKCGTCSIVCPNGLIDFTNKPSIHEECLRDGNGMCFEVCPRTNSAGHHISIRTKLKADYYYGESQREGQSGGVVTTFLEKLLDDGEIDGAIVVGGENWKPVSMLVQDSEGLKDTTKSKYTISSMDAMKEAGKLGLKNVAIVGLPCQIAGLRKLQYFPYIAKHGWERGKNGEPAKLPEIKYLLGLFCTGKFDYTSVTKALKENDINIKDVKKFNVGGPNLEVTTDEGIVKIKLNELTMSPGCLMCRDFDASLADISFGEKGSESKYTTAIIRSPKGEILKKYFDLKEGVKIEEITKMQDFKTKRFNKEVAKRKEEGKYNSYYYLGDYGGVGQGQNGYRFIRHKSTASGYYTPENVIKIAEITKKYGGIVKLTNRAEFELQEIKPEYVEDLLEEINNTDFVYGSEGPLVRSTLSCPGSGHCIYGLIDTTDLNEKVESFHAERPATYKFKVAISGCPNKCVRPSITDFGINGVKFPKTNDDKCNGCGRCQDVCKVEAIEVRGDTSIINRDICIGCGKCVAACPHDAKDIIFEGYSVFIGGKSGRKVVEGSQLFIETEEELLKTLDNVLKLYDKYGEKPQKERLADTMKRVGVVSFLNELNEMS